MQKQISIKVENIKKSYNLYDNSKERLKEILSVKGKKHHKVYNALDDINFEVYKGETFGIIGTNGAGKSTLLKLITGVATPTSGNITVNGKVSALLELGAGFNMNYSGIENIYLNGTMMGYTKADMESKIEAIVDFADIGEYIHQPVKMYSSGMFARLAFAVAINIEPEILIVDEALSVGDVFFQNKCYKKFEDLRKKGITVIFVSHDIGTVKQLCDRVLWIEHGVQQMVGESVEVCNEYSNSILEKRAKEYSKGKSNRTIKGESEYNELILEDYPDISYTPESILDNNVKIISSYIKDEKGQRVSSCLAGKRYTLSVVFSTRREISECIVGFVIETVKGVWITNCNSLISGIKKSFRVKENSMVRYDFTFIMPSLTNGDYVIGVAVSEGDIMDFKVITWLYNVLYMQITNVGNNDGIFLLETEGQIFEKEIINE